MKPLAIGVFIPTSPFRTDDPSCEVLRFSKEQLSNLVPNFTKKIPRGRESMPQSHIDFHDFWTPFEFPVIKIGTRSTTVATPHSRNV